MKAANIGERMRRQGIACILASAVVFGFSPVLTAMSYAGGNNSVNMALIRAVLPLPLILLLARGHLRYTRSRLLRCMVLGACQYTCALLLYSSYAHLPVGIATTVHFLYPLFVALFESLRARRIPSAGTWASLLLALMGCALCSGISTGGGSLTGILLAAVSGVFYAAYIILLARFPGGDMPVYQQMLGMSLTGAVLCVLFGLATNRLTLRLTPSAWLFAACAAHLVSVVAHGLFQKGERLAGEMDAAMFSLLEPISSFLFSALLLSERLTFSKLLGCCLILLALLAHEAAEKRSRS